MFNLLHYKAVKTTKIKLWCDRIHTHSVWQKQGQLQINKLMKSFSTRLQTMGPGPSIVPGLGLSVLSKEEMNTKSGYPKCEACGAGP